MKPLTILIVSIVAFLGIASTAFTLSWYVRKRAYESGYSKIRVGDSEQAVVELYGKPTETSDCSAYKGPGYKEELRNNCVKVYWYKSLLEQWIFFLDKDGKVVYKAYNAMP